jgi:outer membrane protein assembly factor BamB
LTWYPKGHCLTQAYAWVLEASKNGQLYEIPYGKSGLGSAMSVSFDGSEIIATPALITTTTGGCYSTQSNEVVVPTTGGNLYNVGQSTSGALNTTLEMRVGPGLYSTPASSAGVVLFGADDGYFRAVYNNQVLFSFLTGGKIWSGPAVIGRPVSGLLSAVGTVYFGSNDGYVYALSVKGQ